MPRWEGAALASRYALFFFLCKDKLTKVLIYDNSSQMGCRQERKMSSLYLLEIIKNYMRWHIIDGWSGKCAHRCCFPCVPHSAPVPSVTSHRFPRPHSLPYGPSPQPQSAADSGARSVVVMFSLCVSVHSRMCFSIFLPFLSDGVGDMKACRRGDREETGRVDGGERGEVRRSSAEATGRGQSGRQGLIVASRSTRSCLKPTWGQRDTACEAVTRGFRQRLTELHERSG